MSSHTNPATHSKEDSKVVDVIDTIMHHLDLDKTYFKIGIANEDQRKLYESFLPGNELQLLHGMRKQASAHLVFKALQGYFNQLSIRHAKPSDLFIHNNDSRIVIWAIIKDNDEATENALIMAEAHVNTDFSQYGLCLSSIINEESDKIAIAPHFKRVNFKIK